MTNLGDQLQVINLVPVASVSVTGNGTGMDLATLAQEIAIIVDVANVSGTTPTCNLKIQDSDDNSSFADVSGATFTQVSTVASKQKLSLNKDELRRYIRVVRTLAGTSPVYLISASAVGLTKYPA